MVTKEQRQTCKMKPLAQCKPDYIWLGVDRSIANMHKIQNPPKLPDQQRTALKRRDADSSNL